MLFIFANGHQVHSRIGSNICGLSQQGKRPVDVMIGGKELRNFISAVGQEEAMKYLFRQIYPAITQPGDKE